MTTRIAILSDNTVVTSDIRGEHGLAFWVETGGHCILFDTGQGLVMADNAKALNLDLAAVDIVVLSHGHYDHTGGLASVFRNEAGDVRVYAHPDALLQKYHSKQDTVREIGVPVEAREALSGSRCHLIASREPTEVAPGVWSTGEIPRYHPEEATTETFCRDPEGCKDDPLMDDQALFIETEKGSIVVLGCAHAGPINTMDHIQRLTNGRPIRAVLGGMHFGSASVNRLDWTIAQLRRFHLLQLAPLHCTGMKATAALWHTFPGTCCAWGAGSICEF